MHVDGAKSTEVMITLTKPIARKGWRAPQRDVGYKPIPIATEIP